jgi:hypothetical protein
MKIILLLSLLCLAACDQNDCTTLEYVKADGHKGIATECSSRMAALRSVSKACPNGYTIDKIEGPDWDYTMDVECKPVLTLDPITINPCPKGE